jgi:signal transduction histidine kinase
MKGRSKTSRERPKATRRKAASSTRNKGPKVARRRSSSAVEETEIDWLRKELKEAHEREASTAEVLRVISASPGALEPVFKRMLDNAVRLCDAKFGNIYLVEHGTVRLVATHNTPPAFVEFRKHTPPSTDPKTPSGRLLRTKAVVHIPNLAAEESYREGHSGVVAAVELLGERTSLHVPMLKEGELVGYLSIYRQEVRPFTDKQIALVENFAAQAVIAIENMRLFQAEQERTRELSESLTQQTAIAEVLKLISRSTFDLKSVLNALVESAAQMCEADMAQIQRPQGEAYRYIVSYGFPREFEDFMEDRWIVPDRGTILGRAVLEKRTIHIPDVRADPEYTFGEASRVGGFRTALAVPLQREGISIGVIILTRSSVRPFTDKQIELVSTFADQAVIAIENVRLFDETQEKSRQLAEASQHKSQFLANMSHELRTPLNAILGYTELLAEGVYGAPLEKMSAVLKRIESNGTHLLGLINAVLDLSKIEAGQLTLNLADYSLANVVQTVHSAVEPLAADKKLTLKTEVAPALPPGHGDERRLIQVLLNLVGNAIKFTDMGEVVITAAASDGLFALSVRDTGPGISTADQAKLFQDFQQADNSITRKKGGTGLGLAISKRIVEMHGGTICLESQVGQGSTFFVTLPVRAEQQTKSN